MPDKVLTTIRIGEPSSVCVEISPQCYSPLFSHRQKAGGFVNPTIRISIMEKLIKPRACLVGIVGEDLDTNENKARF
jgi:hypothetical protein